LGSSGRPKFGRTPGQRTAAAWTDLVDPAVGIEFGASRSGGKSVAHQDFTVDAALARIYSHRDGNARELMHRPADT
jgi:hypothetical protein